MRPIVIMIVAITLILATLGCVATESKTMQTMTYYVSPSGDDADPGTLDSPWRTLQHALGQLQPGDVVYLRGGTYYEHEILTSLKGTAAAPITIQSYPGERAVIDGGVPYFKDTSGSEWELVDASIGLYRSVRTFSGNFIRAWLVNDDKQLVEYRSVANLESTNYGPVNGFAPFYMGPGVLLGTDGRIYIRLQYNPNDLADASGNPIGPTPRDTNPNHNRLAIFNSDPILLLDGAAYLHFNNLDFSYAESIFDVRNGSHDVELNGCHLNYGTYGLVIRNGIHDWDIHDCDFNNGLPDYVYWTDVKNGDHEVAEAYPEFQSDAIIGATSGFYIHNNVFHDTFDGIEINAGTTNARIISNTIKYTRDNAIDVDKGIANVEIAHNMLWHVGEGISNLGSSGVAGDVYIHHNVIDISAYVRGGRPGNYRSDNWPVWTVIDPFGSHDNGDRASWWKLYNNTIVTRRGGYMWNSSGPDDVTGNGFKYVYNNIFYVLDDRVILRDDLTSFGSHYDGNVFFRNAPGSLPMFVHFGDGRDYSSLVEFKQTSGTNWEEHGLESDPGFSVSAINDPTFDAATIWDRYRPTSADILTPGASYCGFNWPETQGVNYRGAVPPATPVALAEWCVFLPLFVVRS